MCVCVLCVWMGRWVDVCGYVCTCMCTWISLPTFSPALSLSQPYWITVLQRHMLTLPQHCTARPLLKGTWAWWCIFPSPHSREWSLSRIPDTVNFLFICVFSNIILFTPLSWLLIKELLAWHHPSGTLRPAGAIRSDCTHSPAFVPLSLLGFRLKRWKKIWSLSGTVGMTSLS